MSQVCSEHFHSHESPRRSGYCDPPFAGEETETQRGQIPCLRLYSEEWWSQDEISGIWAPEWGSRHCPYCLLGPTLKNSQEWGSDKHLLSPDNARPCARHFLWLCHLAEALVAFLMDVDTETQRSRALPRSHREGVPKLAFHLGLEGLQSSQSSLLHVRR